MAWSNQAIYQCAQDLQRHPELSFNIAAGSDPNEAHLEGGGYHVYYDRLPNDGRFDYSSGLASARNTNPRDRNGPPHKSAAWDLGFDASDMVLVSQRIQAAIDRGDPAMDNVREVNLWFGGDADPVNRDHELGWRQNYVPAASHKSHIHVAWYRDVADNYEAIRGFVDIVTGTSSGHSASGGNAAPITSEEDDMPFTEAELRKMMHEEARSAIAQMAAPTDPTTKKPGELYGRIAQAVWGQRITLAGLGTDTAASLLANARSLAGQARNAANSIKNVGA